MLRFGRRNLIQPISVNQFKDTAFKLVEALQQVRDDLNITLSLTMNGAYYDSMRGITVVTKEIEEAAEVEANQAKIIDIDSLNDLLWEQSYSRGLKNCLGDETSYMINMSNGERESKRLRFYGQALDENSLEVLKSFNKRDRIFQILDDGFPLASEHAFLNTRITLGG